MRSKKHTKIEEKDHTIEELRGYLKFYDFQIKDYNKEIKKMKKERKKYKKQLNEKLMEE